MSGNYSEEEKQVCDMALDWEKDFEEFTKLMRSAIIRNIWKKGYPTKNRLKEVSNKFLIDRMSEHIDALNWKDVANFAFMLYQKNGEKKL